MGVWFWQMKRTPYLFDELKVVLKGNIVDEEFRWITLYKTGNIGEKALHWNSHYFQSGSF